MCRTYRVGKLYRRIAEKQSLEFYCDKNGFDADRARNAYLSYQSIDVLVQKVNDKYISQKMAEEKEYLDTILKEIDPAIRLDDD